MDNRRNVAHDEERREAFYELLRMAETGIDVDYDMYSQNINDWKWLSDLIPGIIVSSAGGMCPFQAEGLLSGMPFYYRERHDRASLTVGSASVNHALDEPLYAASANATGHWIEMLLNLVLNLKKAPFLWGFSGQEVKFADPQDVESAYTDGTVQEYFARGETPEEAYQALATPSPYLSANGWSDELQRRLWEMQAVSPEPFNSDDRVFPSTDPEFVVNVPETWKTTTNRITVPAGIFD